MEHGEEIVCCLFPQAASSAPVSTRAEIFMYFFIICLQSYLFLPANIRKKSQSMISLPWDLCFIGETSLHVPDVTHQVLVLLAHNFGNLVRLLFWLFPIGLFRETTNRCCCFRLFKSFSLPQFLNYDRKVLRMDSIGTS